MSKAVPWDEAEVRGPKLAYTITPENCGRMLRRAKRLLIVVGGNILDEEYTKAGTLHILERIVKKTNATLAISAGVFKAFHRFEDAKYAVNVESLVDRLKDGNWMGFDGKGGYDFILFVGSLYPFQSMMLATLKHFAPNIRTLTIERYYHPNAEFSLENLSFERWRDGLEALVKALEA
ncbi:MAG: CO dehydrogenase/acetyl-CoA synthase complex subunit epsilon [Nitrososphaerales archaeon]